MTSGSCSQPPPRRRGLLSVHGDPISSGAPLADGLGAGRDLRLGRRIAPRNEITPERERRGTISAMHFRWLRWLTVAVPLLFLALVDLLRHQVWPDMLYPWPGYLIVLGIVAGATWLFSRLVFDRVESMEQQIVGQNAQ